MKEVFEIDMKGNGGAGIAEIISFSKNTVQLPIDNGMDLPDEEIQYEIHLKLKNGIEEKIKFKTYFEVFKEHNCFGKDVQYYREKK